LVLVLIAPAVPGAGAGSGAQQYSRAASACAPATDPTKPARPTKPSSFAPRARPANNAYGAPIQKQILRSHPKPKPHLKTAPLP
jgi:hypothetical protein